MKEFATHLAEGGHLREDLSVMQTAERLSVLTDPELYRLTVGARSWSHQQYEDWLGEMFIASVLPKTPRRQGRRGSRT